MKLPVPFIQLPLAFDAGVLAAEIDALGEEAWRPHPQKFPGNSMLPLLAVGGEAGNESFSGTMMPTPALRRCPYLMQVIASLGVVAGRSRLMRLAGQAEVTPHVDQGYYWTDRVRVHVPVVTQPTVRFDCGGEVTHMAAGECWIFDTWRVHNVVNDASRSRIHLVVDTVGGAVFWNHVARGRRHDDVDPQWAPAFIAPSGERVELACERYNIPDVMTPWEIHYRLHGLLDEVEPGNPLLPAARAASDAFARDWRALWAQHGDSGEGRTAYQATLETFITGLPDAVAALPLRNGTLWINGVLAVVAKMALRPAPAR